MGVPRFLEPLHGLVHVLGGVGDPKGLEALGHVGDGQIGVLVVKLGIERFHPGMLGRGGGFGAVRPGVVGVTGASSLLGVVLPIQGEVGLSLLLGEPCTHLGCRAISLD